jgi:hypothetical protein
MIKGQKDPVGWVLKHLQVRFPGESEILEIFLDTGGPAEAASLVNAITRTYMDEVLGRDQKERNHRLQALKELRKTYADLMHSRRVALRQLNSATETNDLEKQTSKRVYRDLRLQETKLRLEKAEAATLLERRKQGDEAGADTARKEIARLKDRLAVLDAQIGLLEQERDRLSRNNQKGTEILQDLSDLKEELSQIEESQKKINIEIESLSVDLTAPPRIRLLELAEPVKSEDDQS